MGLQRSPKDSKMSDGGLSASRTASASQSSGSSSLGSSVSGEKFPGKAPTAGAGPDSPSVKAPAGQAADAGRISTEGQARGGPRQMSDAVATPGAGTKAGKGKGKSGGSL